MGNGVNMKDFKLSLSTDAGVTFNPIAGFKARELTRENPVEDNTNQATTGNETESCYTGYSTVNISGSGTCDTRTAALHALNDLIATANSADPVVLIRLENTAMGSYEGNFNITSFGIDGEENGLAKFSIALQNESTVTFTAGV